MTKYYTFVPTWIKEFDEKVDVLKIEGLYKDRKALNSAISDWIQLYAKENPCPENCDGIPYGMVLYFEDIKPACNHNMICQLNQPCFENHLKYESKTRAETGICLYKFGSPGNIFLIIHIQKFESPRKLNSGEYYAFLFRRRIELYPSEPSVKLIKLYEDKKEAECSILEWMTKNSDAHRISGILSSHNNSTCKHDGSAIRLNLPCFREHFKYEMEIKNSISTYEMESSPCTLSILYIQKIKSPEN